jgi:hypothetical protein
LKRFQIGAVVAFPSNALAAFNERVEQRLADGE